MPDGTSFPHHGILKQIAGINLEPLMVKAMAEDGKSLADAEKGVTELRRFYTLCALHPNQALSPSTFMDGVWHLHILDTEQYPLDCQTMFGRMLHHFPYFGILPEEKAALDAAFKRTQELYRMRFGREMEGAPSGTHCVPQCRTGANATTCRIDLASTLCGIKRAHCPAPGTRPTLKAYLESIAAR